ncbi:PTS transporter subunit EIIC [Anaerocolumna jejuensis]|uniref:PTS transporter subunit EIIC n=1 Tax=Anaerocolumna jejuensis TaxID=259063 RepID=UPI003F7C4CF3
MTKKEEIRRIAEEVLQAVGGKENIANLTHCMTRLRFDLKDKGIPNDEEVKKIRGVVGVARGGNQYQVIIGTQVAQVFDELAGIVPSEGTMVAENQNEKTKKGFKEITNTVFDYLSGSLTPIIPILLVASLCKTIAAIIGPQLLHLVSDKNDLYTLFMMVGNAGFYFLPVFIGNTAAKKFKCNPVIGMLLGALLVNPTLIDMASNGTKFSVYGIPSSVQNYTSSVIPIILTIWIMSYVERFFKKYTPDILKIFLVPLGTVLVMLPLELCLLGPLGSFLGKYLCNGIISLNSVAGPLAVAIVAGTFVLLVITGMHPVLFTYLFVTFPELGKDSFLMPGMLAASWAFAGVTLACALKFKDKDKKSLTLGYFLTWLFGGVGEPILYALMVPYKTPLLASMIAGFITGLVTGFSHLTAYILNTANGIYLPPSFVGGTTSNYIALVVTMGTGLISGFIVMMFFKLDEQKVA